MPAQFSQTTRSLANDSSRLSLAVWLVAGVLLAGWATWLAWGSVTVYETSSQARLEVRQASYALSAQRSGTVVSASLAIDAKVTAGDILVRLDDSREQLQLNEERVRLASLPARLAAVEREMVARGREQAQDLASAQASREAARLRGREADVTVDMARDYEARVEQLKADGLIAPLDARRAAADTQKATATRDSLASELSRIDIDAQTRVNGHQATLEQLRREAAALEGEAAASRAAIARLEAEVERLVIRAPVDGRIGELTPTHAGAHVAEGQTLATIIPTGELMVIAEFSPSVTLGRVRAGQKGRLRFDGFPWGQYGTLPVTVARVGSEVRDKAVRVELTIDTTLAGIPMQHGLPGTAEVAVEQVSPATLVLRAAGLLLAGTNAPDALVAESQR